ncbi:MAG: gliding motility-associated C-terminal domain-containing protein [Bacteroidota bacterium]
MKIKFFVFSFFLNACLSIVFAQKNTAGWSADYKKSRSFIENVGQFDQFENQQTGKIKYAVDFGETRIFFGIKGIRYSFLEATKIPKEERESLKKQLANSVEEYKKKEKLVGKFLFKSDDVNMEWAGSSQKTELVGEGLTEDYHNYSYQNSQGEIIGASYAKGFKKLYYRNLYPGIDVEYTVHPEIGIKYAVIIHPGADVSALNMLFDRDLSVLEGKLDIPTYFGSIVDHAPVTFYGDDHNTLIESNFFQQGRRISFKLGEYDPSRTVIIDPWTQTPAFNTNWDVVWECERDGAGNVYILGGIMPMQVLKYNNAGALQWTYSTPYDTSNCWLGTLATDLAGNSYVTRGSVSGMQKISSAGTLTWNNTGGGGSIGNSDEYWSIAFNCDQTKLIVGGTSGAFALPPLLEAAIFEINTSNGNYTNTIEVAVGPTLSIPPNVQEVRSITAAPNGKYYWLTQDTIGYLNDNTTFCSLGSSSFYKTTNGTDFGYKCEDYRYDNTGICALAADENALYVNRGNQLQKRSLTDGSILNTVNIPGGALNSVFLGGNTVSNSGIDIDDCGNVYVGSTTGVYKFNSSLVQQAFYPTSFKVFDVEVNTAGEVIACGGTGTSASGTRTGGIQSFAASACAPLAASCCNATVCGPNTLCVSDAPVTLTTETSGGTWSGPGISATGVFNPSTAGVGTHTITYTLPCGFENYSIVVSSCSALQVCQETNGTLTVSGGVGPYTWQQWIPAQTVTITNQTQCQSCGYTWNALLGQCLNGFFPATSCTQPAAWSTFATGTNVTAPAGLTQLQVLDNSGGSLAFDLNTVLDCTSNPCPTITVGTSALSNILCFGQTNGSATVAASGGQSAYSYTWTPGNLSGATQSALSAGTYTVNVLDANNCPGSTTVTITQPSSAVSATATATPTNCGASTGTTSVVADGGTGSYNYSWLPTGGTGATASNLAAGNYTVTVTDANGCTATATASVVTNNGPTISVTSSDDVSCFGGSDGAASVTGSGGSGALTYTWTPGNLTGASQIALAAGTYTVTVADAAGCTNSTTVTIDEPSEVIVTQGTIIPADCGISNGSASVTASGGAGGYTYAWSPTGGNGQTATNIAAGTYTVTVTDQNSCSESITLVVNNANGPSVSAQSVNNVSCFGGNDGSATVNVSGGTSPYTYSWSPTGGSGATASGLSAGTYSVAVTDNLGCVGSVSLTVGEPTAIAINETIIDANCGASDGSISVVAAGGTGSFTYSWSPTGGSAATASGLTAGNYTVTVTDQEGCTSSGTFTVENIGELPVSVSPITQTIVSGESVQLQATGATSYSWNNGSTLSCDDCPAPVATPTITTTYTVTGTDDSGCTGTAQVTIVVQLECGDFFVPTVFSPNGEGPSANNSLCVFGNCIAELQYAVYNRWGEVVFSTEDPEKCWDGNFRNQPVQSGVYAYKVYAVLFDGTEINESGNLTILK